MNGRLDPTSYKFTPSEKTYSVYSRMREARQAVGFYGPTRAVTVDMRMDEYISIIFNSLYFC